MKKIRYGDGGTIHQSSEINIELDENGDVVGVWFRCLHLPFTQTVVHNERAGELDSLYQKGVIQITAIKGLAEDNDRA